MYHYMREEIKWQILSQKKPSLFLAWVASLNV